MISKIEIKDYKNIKDFELLTGKINLFIGDNQVGKSNLLDAICTELKFPFALCNPTKDYLLDGSLINLLRGIQSYQSSEWDFIKKTVYDLFCIELIDSDCNYIEHYSNDKAQVKPITTMSTGLLYTLFYLGVSLSNSAPQTLLLDDFGAHLNTKLCEELFFIIIEKTPKQLFIATQNPSCLDALNIDDDLQRLFIVSKSTKGMFRCKRWTKNLEDSVYDSLNRTLIEDHPYTKQEILALVSNSKEYLRLSTGYRYGILGGLSKFY